MAAILLDIKPGDEVIAPSYTFVSTVNAFVLRGANIILVDSYKESPCIDAEKIKAHITSKTKAIVVVHYAGIACDMDKIMDIAIKHDLFVVEDAAHAIDSFYISGGKKTVPLGLIGNMAVFSFHETKNIISGEGGLLVVNDGRFKKRAEIVWERGTQRAAFFRGEIKKYEWIDIGSAFLPSEFIAAFLYAQLENLEVIQSRRKKLWIQYYTGLKNLETLGVRLPYIPEYSSNNAHIFFLICRGKKERSRLAFFLKEKGILTATHYPPLHRSPFYNNHNPSIVLENVDYFSNCLLRLPLFVDLQTDDVKEIVNHINSFYYENLS